MVARFGLALLVVAGCQSVDTGRANEKAAQANTSIEEGNRLFGEADTATNTALAGMDLPPGEARDEALAGARACAAALDGAVPAFEKASGLLSEASRMRITPPFAAYLDLKSQEMKKRAELGSLQRELCGRLADGRSDALDVLKGGRAATLSREADELAEKAEEKRIEAGGELDDP
ncbi:MAG: hypothetical protein U0271_29880 [Polyangiaceae bacterium]